MSCGQYEEDDLSELEVKGNTLPFVGLSFASDTHVSSSFSIIPLASPSSIRLLIPGYSRVQQHIRQSDRKFRRNTRTGKSLAFLIEDLHVLLDVFCRFILNLGGESSRVGTPVCSQLFGNKLRDLNEILTSHTFPLFLRAVGRRDDSSRGIPDSYTPPFLQIVVIEWLSKHEVIETSI